MSGSLHTDARTFVEIVASVNESIEPLDVLMLTVMLRHIQALIAVERRQHVERWLLGIELPL